MLNNVEILVPIIAIFILVSWDLSWFDCFLHEKSFL